MSRDTLPQMDDTTREFCEKYNLVPSRDLWSTQRTDKRGRVTIIWQIKNNVLQRIAANERIFFEKMTILEGNALSGLCVMQVTAVQKDEKGERIMEVTSIGEATPTTVKIPYPYAMAEKRAKGRAILQILSIYGHIYSEDEFSEEEQSESNKQDALAAKEKSIEQTKKLIESIKIAGRVVDEVMKVVEDRYILNELNGVFHKMRKEEGVTPAEEIVLKKVLDKVENRLKEIDAA